MKKLSAVIFNYQIAKLKTKSIKLIVEAYSSLITDVFFICLKDRSNLIKVFVVCLTFFVFSR